MSVPQQKIFDDNNLKYFIRISEIEKNVKISKAKGAWVDSFFKIWYSEKVLKKIKYNRLVIVSSELHKRKDYRKQWNMLRSLNLNKKLLICTDYPNKADHFFNDKK